MSIQIYPNKIACGQAAARCGATAIKQAIEHQGYATIIVATGASQFEMLSALTKDREVDWSKVTLFHLDEYAGIAETHPASFRKYIKELFIAKLPSPLQATYFINGDAPNIEEMCADLNNILQSKPVDVCFIGIGENGHIAFNDPPANFDTETPYLVVELDESCRRQQLDEGWFQTLEDVPRRAISMSVQQILKSQIIINTVPDYRKSVALKNTLEGPLTPEVPASVIRLHPSCHTFCDKFSADGLSPITQKLCQR